MDSKALGVKLKTLRLKKGYSQDELAESAGVSLRTVQRMENAEAIPRMDTVRRLFQIFGMSPDEVFDWTQTEDKGYLIGMNLSGLAFVLIPLLGVVLPIVLWMSRKDKITGVSELGRQLVNFQITWAAFYYLATSLIIWIASLMVISGSGDIQPSYLVNGSFIRLGLIAILYSFIIVMISWNTYRIYKGLPSKYFPKINFLK
ncbi:helix-turn-helix domain-containing protein [Algoriphagus chordae]|uniref:Helix-turn-helix protein n=1 Tax=Algoriphagus chordae TaxID=237019 RepID=A0A2W7R695_9BACT|nr:helix-turn-helix domain-containing protein [Algoriphagus chordae]PZX55651.1 helix-turn-helix protein [Algoriphagus chordae]